MLRWHAVCLGAVVPAAAPTRLPMPSPLDSLRETVQALAIEAGLVAWRIERELATHAGGDGTIRVPDPTAPLPPPDRLRLTRVQRGAP